MFWGLLEPPGLMLVTVLLFDGLESGRNTTVVGTRDVVLTVLVDLMLAVALTAPVGGVALVCMGAELGRFPGAVAVTDEGRFETEGVTVF